MCIIVYKPVGVALPPRETLKNCFDNNPDGAGFMLRTRNGVKIDKGYFNFEDFYKNLMKIKNINSFEVGLHFRIATHGTVNALNCHPFSVTKKLKKIRKVQQTTAAAVMHNGVLSSVQVKNSSGLSDTVVYTRDVLYNLSNLTACNLTTTKQAIDTINATRGTSRLLIFDKNGAKLFGNFIKENGVYYSNDSFKTSYASFWNTSIYTNETPKFNACKNCLWLQECNAYGAYCMTEKQATQEALNSAIIDDETEKGAFLYDI